MPLSPHLPGPAVGLRILPIDHPGIRQHRGTNTCRTQHCHPLGTRPSLGTRRGSGDTSPPATSSRTRLSIAAMARVWLSQAPASLKSPPVSEALKGTPGNGHPVPSWILVGGLNINLGLGGTWHWHPANLVQIPNPLVPYCFCTSCVPAQRAPCPP